MAHHDGLPNLPNRELYQDRLREALEQTQTGNRKVAVLCVDLDLFKNVSDSFGHPMGDRLLRLVADRLRSQAEGVETIDQLDWLRAEGCNEGFLFSPAKPAAEVGRLLSKFGRHASRAA